MGAVGVAVWLAGMVPGSGAGWRAIPLRHNPTLLGPRPTRTPNTPRICNSPVEARDGTHMYCLVACQGSIVYLELAEQGSSNRD